MYVCTYCTCILHTVLILLIPHDFESPQIDPHLRYRSMSASQAKTSDDRQPSAENAATTMADNVGYCRLVTVAPFSTHTSFARRAPVPLSCGPAHTAHLSDAIRRSFGDAAPTHHGSLPAASPFSTHSHVAHRCCDCSRRATCSLMKLKGKAPACACKLEILAHPFLLPQHYISSPAPRLASSLHHLQLQASPIPLKSSLPTPSSLLRSPFLRPPAPLLNA